LIEAGFQTTLLDTTGAKEMNEYWEKKSPPNNKDDDAEVQIIGGFNGILACDVLRLGSGLCDEHGRLHLKESRLPEQHENNQNDFVSNHQKTRNNPEESKLTNEQLEEMERVLLQYDCALFQHIKNKDNRMWRFLHKSGDLFANCPEGGPTAAVSTVDTVNELIKIAQRENGIVPALMKKE